MIVFDLKQVILGGLLILAGTALLAIVLDRRHTSDPLSARTRMDGTELRRALEAAPLGVVLLDGRQQCLYANAYAGRLLKVEPNSVELPATPWRDQFLQDVAAAGRDAMSGTQHRIFTSPGGEVLSWWICTLANGAWAWLSDLTRQSHLEKSSAIFLGSLSHELKTPLAAILAHAELLSTADLPEPVRQTSLSFIHQETQRIIRLAQGLLELSRLETTPQFDLRPVDLLLVAEAAVAEVILQAEAQGIPLSLEADPALPRVLGDPDRLKQVFLNLLDNAVKYCRTGDQVQVRLQKQPGGVFSIVQDSGPGIPPEHLPQVTQRLYRARTDVAGSGLGLNITEEILRIHQSGLEIISEHGGGRTGTTVRFLLPAAQPD
jgi:two-component system phosphate regulon sensor histidine kinase PhoR